MCSGGERVRKIIEKMCASHLRPSFHLRQRTDGILNTSWELTRTMRKPAGLLRRSQVHHGDSWSLIRSFIRFGRCNSDNKLGTAHYSARCAHLSSAIVSLITLSSRKMRTILVDVFSKIDIFDDAWSARRLAIRLSFIENHPSSHIIERDWGPVLVHSQRPCLLCRKSRKSAVASTCTHVITIRKHAGPTCCWCQYISSVHIFAYLIQCIEYIQFSQMKWLSGHNRLTRTAQSRD